MAEMIILFFAIALLICSVLLFLNLLQYCRYKPVGYAVLHTENGRIHGAEYSSWGTVWREKWQAERMMYETGIEDHARIIEVKADML